MRASLTAGILLGLTVVCHFLIQAIGAHRLRVVKDKIAAKIKRRSDLVEVSAAIQINMLLGGLMICNAALLIGTLFWLSNVWLWLVGPLVLAVEQAVAWLLFRPIERQFRALLVESNDGDLAVEYAYYLKQWAGPYLFLRRLQLHQGKEQGTPPNVIPPHR